MALYQEKYYEAQRELQELKTANAKRDADSLARSAVLFIQSKGLTEEWVEFLIKEIDERARP